MIRRREVKEIRAKLDTLTNTIASKAVAYDKSQDLLKDVQIRIAKAYPIFDENTLRYGIRIEYSVAPTTLYLDDDGETMVNCRFKAMNGLDLIPLEDLQLVSEAITKANTLNKGGNA